MDIVEKFNRNFGSWFERLFGTQDPAGPRDVLRKVLSAMEASRREGLDGNVYVPNQVNVTLCLENSEELSALAMFLSEPDLKAAVSEFIAQEGYRLKSPLLVTVTTVDISTHALEYRDREPVEISCRFSADQLRAVAPTVDDELHTVAAGFLRGTSKQETNAGYLVVKQPGQGEERFTLTSVGIRIGRSKSAGNSVVLTGDSLVSRSHAIVALDSADRAYVEDLGSLNGTMLNGEKISRSSLSEGDEITIGQTTILFSGPPPVDPGTNLKMVGTFGGVAGDVNGTGSGPLPPSRVMRPAAAALITWGDAPVTERFYLATENVIGRSPTCDLVLPSRGVYMRHALVRKTGNSFTIEKLDPTAGLEVDGHIVDDMLPIRISHGSVIAIGDVIVRLDGESA